MFKLSSIILILSITVLLFFSCKNNKVIKQPTVKTPKKTATTIKPKIETGAEIAPNFLSKNLITKHKNISFKIYIYVSVKEQRLYLIKNDSIIKKYPISTSTKGIGSEANSYKTPSGLHIIKKKIGGNVPFGGILKSRIYTGKIAKILTQKENADKDYITTRIMWLQGKEPGINKGRKMDSYNRYIYIHGTPEEGYIGQPASRGCIRMKNKDVIELYNLVNIGLPVLISKY